MAKEPVYHVTNARLVEEILKSQAIQAKLPEEERQEKAAECLTPELVKMLKTLVDRYATGWQWRGYTWNDDMRAEATYNLCRVALKFNYEKAIANGNPANPFGYYTIIVKRIFITVIQRENKQGRIKDEIIEMSDTDLLPSFGRQNEDAGNSLGIDLDGTKRIPSDPMIRRRKKKKNIRTEDDLAKMSEAEQAEWLEAKKSEFLKNKKITRF